MLTYNIQIIISKKLKDSRKRNKWKIPQTSFHEEINKRKRKRAKRNGKKSVLNVTEITSQNTRMTVPSK